MNILFFSNFYPPEIGAAPMRASDHAKYWAREGHKVVIITNFPNSPFGKYYAGYKNSFYQKEVIDGVTVVRVLTFASGKRRSKWHRLASVLFNTIGSLVAGIMVSRPDIILATAPYSSGLPGALVSKLRKSPMIYELRDPWLQVASHNADFKKISLMLKVARVYEKWVIKTSKELVVIGDNMAQLIQNDLKLTDKPSVIRNSVNRNVVNQKPTSVEIPLTSGDKFRVGIVGNMGSQYDYDTIIKAAETLKNKSIEFIFLGEGKEKKSVEENVRKRGLDNVLFYPPVDSGEVDAWIRSFNVTVVSLKSGTIFEVYLPVKIFGSMHAGVPVILCGAGESKALIEESKCGSTCTPGNFHDLASIINKYKENPEQIVKEGQAGMTAVKEKYNREKMASDYLDIMRKLVE